MTTPSYEEREYHKVPKFSGKKEDWAVWSDKFLTVLERKGMPVLTEQLDTTEEVPKDSDDCSDGKSPPAVTQEKLDYKLQNAKAFAYLYDSIDDTPGPGKNCYYRVKAHKNPDTGYKRGNFKTAWLELKALFEPKDLDTMIKTKTAYYDRKLGMQEHPTTFLTEMRNSEPN